MTSQFAKPLTRRLTTILLATLLWPWCSDAGAYAIRRTWEFEQLAQLMPPTHADQTRHALAASLVTYPDTLSLQVDGTLDFRQFELHAQGSRRFFYSPNDAFAQAMNYERDTVSVELARYQALSRSAFGRLSLGVIKFLPELSPGQKPLAEIDDTLKNKDKQLWVHLGVGTGILPHDELPWDFRLALGLFRRIDDDWMVIFTRVEALRGYWDGRLKLGGFLSWSNISLGSNTDLRVTSDKSAPIIEHYAFTVGPEVEWTFFAGVLHVAMPLRLYLDMDESQSAQSPPTGPVFYNSQFLAPALSASYTLQF